MSPLDILPSGDKGAEEATVCADRLKVLADSTRLEVMRLLLEQPLHVGDLQRRLEIEQSLLSHHLRVLRGAGLVTSERDGKAVLYQVATDVSASSVQGDAIHLGCCVLSFDAGSGGRR